MIRVLIASLIACLLALPVFAADPITDGPLFNEPLISPAKRPDGAKTQGNIYECKPKHYDPPCRLIGTRPDDPSDEQRMAELLAAIRASRSGAETPILGIGDTGPILRCGPHHGQSACCRIIYRDGDTVYIECGPR
jgi:hypothetical protein